MDNSELYQKAHLAGLAAGEAIKPQPMTVGTSTSLFGGEIDPTKPIYFVPDGVCGFAWVKIKGNTAFARWVKKEGRARPGYPGGLEIGVSFFGQSLQRKEAYAQAFAKVLTENGISAYADSRLD